MLARYREILREPHIARLLVTAMVGRAPQGMTSLAILLLLTPRVGYGKAGAATGLVLAGGGLGAVVLARAVDRIGARPVLLPAAASYATAAVALALTVGDGYAVSLVLCAVLGVSAPPISSVSRGMWRGLVGDEKAQVLYGLEATAQEVVFLAGPAGVALIAALANPKAALISSGALGLIGVLGFVTAPPFRRLESDREHSYTRTALWRTQVPAYAAVGFALAVGFSMTEIATVAFVGGRHATAGAGVVLAVWAAGSLVGGLVFGAGSEEVTDRGLGLAILLVAVGAASAAAAPGEIGLAVILFVAGLPGAPTMARVYSRVVAVAPEASRTEAFGWLAVGLQAGFSAGAALGGLSIDGIGARATFLVCGASALSAVLVIRVASYGAVRQAADQDAARPSAGQS